MRLFAVDAAGYVMLFFSFPMVCDRNFLFPVICDETPPPTHTHTNTRANTPAYTGYHLIVPAVYMRRLVLSSRIIIT